MLNSEAFYEEFGLGSFEEAIKGCKNNGVRDELELVLWLDTDRTTEAERLADRHEIDFERALTLLQEFDTDLASAWIEKHKSGQPLNTET